MYGICMVYTIHIPCKIFIGVPDDLDSCHTRYRRSPTISYVMIFDIVGPVLDVVYHIVYTISYIRYCFHEHTILDVRYRMFIQYRMLTYDIVCMLCDIVPQHENVSYRMYVITRDVACPQCTISYVHIVCNIVCHIRYRIFMYDIIC